MTSLLTAAKQLPNTNGYYIPVGDLVGKVYWHVDVANTGVGGGTFSTAAWAALGAGASLSSINGAGKGLLRDMGRTIVSSLRTFRKVQLVVNSVSTFGVGGRSGTSATPTGEDYFTGYIELGFDGLGNAAPVAQYGR